MLEGKRGVVLGVANRRSIAWAVAKAAKTAGAEIALNYATERFKGNVDKLAESEGIKLVLPCDVTSDEEITAFFETIRREWVGDHAPGIVQVIQ